MATFLLMQRFHVLPFALSFFAITGCGGPVPPAGGSGGSVGAGGAGTGGSVGSGGGSLGSGGAVVGTGGGTLGTGGGSLGSGGSTGGSVGTGGTGGGDVGSGGGTSGGGLGNGDQEGEGSSDEQYYTAEVSRDGVPYVFITNGWGPGFTSHTNSWLGTSFVVDAMQGNAGSNGEPASYPTVFCGRYSVQEVPDCGLPAARDSLASLKTGWRWKSNGNDAGQYNAAYDIWLGTETQFQSYFMVWLRDPTNFQPAGSKNNANLGISVANVPGVWDIWDGSVNSRPIVNYVRAEGMDSPEIEFDVLDFLADAQTRGFSIPTHIRAVAVGFEIWEGPIAGLTSEDFYVDVKTK